MPLDPALATMGEEKYVSLSTFRRTGEAVPTPVWIARDGDALVVTTPSSSGKVKRLRNNPQVTLQPCSRRGKVKDDAPVVTGVAAVAEGDAAQVQPTGQLQRKYGLKYRVITVIERLRGSKAAGRVILRITSG